MRFGAKLLVILFLFSCGSILSAQESETVDYAQSIKFIWREKSSKAEVENLFSKWKKSLAGVDAVRLEFDDLSVQWLLRKEFWSIEEAGTSAGMNHLKQSIELYPAAGLYPSAQIIRNLAESNAKAVCDSLVAGAKESYAKGDWYAIRDKYKKIEEISFNIHSENWYGYKARAQEIFRAFREYERYVQTNDDFWLNMTVFSAGIFFDVMFTGIAIGDPVNNILGEADNIFYQYMSATPPLSPEDIADAENRIRILYSRANSLEVIHWMSGIIGVGMTVTGSYLLLQESEDNKTYLNVKLKPFFE